jgi:hypothetical protein
MQKAMMVGRQYGNLVNRRKRNEPGGNIDPGTKSPGYVSMGFERNPQWPGLLVRKHIIPDQSSDPKLY